MLVEDLMVTELVTCERDASLQTAAERMLERGVGSVIVLRGGNPYGIVTETDALQAGATTKRPFVDVSVERAVSHPLVTTTGDTTIRTAVNRMKEHDIKKLPVVDGTTLRGLVTRTDIVSHYDDFIAEAHALDQRREQWEARKQDIDEF
ncbi:MAG: CBS domain-containing protein [Haloplanus sp.]